MRRRAARSTSAHVQWLPRCTGTTQRSRSRMHSLGWPTPFSRFALVHRRTLPAVQGHSCLSSGSLVQGYISAHTPSTPGAGRISLAGLPRSFTARLACRCECDRAYPMHTLFIDTRHPLHTAC